MTSDTHSPPRSPYTYHSRDRSDSKDSRRSGESSRRSRESRDYDRDRSDYRHSSHRRSRSRDSERSSHRSSRRSDERDRRSRDGGRERDSRRSRYDDRYDDRYDSRRSDHRRSVRYKSPVPVLDDDDRDRRTVFAQQLSARLRTKDLIRFFEKAGPVRDASIVKDKNSGRSKGVAYIEFRDQESVLKAIDMTGERLLGIPVIVQHTEAEKNRLALESATATALADGTLPPHAGRGSSSATTSGSSAAQSGPVESRIYAGNIHFQVTENELRQIFEPFGEIEFVTLQREPTGKSKGYAFVQ